MDEGVLLRFLIAVAPRLVRKLRRPDLEITDPRTIPGDCAVDFKCSVTLLNHESRRLRDVRVSARIAPERALGAPMRLSVWRCENPLGLPVQDGRDEHIPILTGDPIELTIDGQAVNYDPFSIRVTEGEPDAVEVESRHLEITVEAPRPGKWARWLIGDFVYVECFKWGESPRRGNLASCGCEQEGGDDSSMVP